MSFRGRLLAAAFGATLGLAATCAMAETLADALALAYESNPTLQAQRASQRALDETYVQARTNWRPTLNLSVQTTYQDIRKPRAIVSRLLDNTTETDSGFAGLTFNQPIWTGGRVGAAVSAARADVLQGRETLRRIENQVMQQVVQVYMDVRRDQEALRIQQENVTVLQNQLEESQARFDVGDVTRTDVAQSQARLSISQSQLESARAQLATSRANYASIVGQNPGDLAQEPTLDYLMPLNPDEAYDLAEKFSPALRAQQYAADASRIRIAEARAQRMPNVSVQATLNSLGPLHPYDSHRYDREFTATAGVTLPLFAGGLRTSQIRQQIERNNVDRINVESVRRSLLQQVTQDWNLLIAARANVASSEVGINAAKIAAEGTRQEQQVGLRTTIDVLNAEQDLRSAQLVAVQSRHDQYVQAASLLAVMGRLEARNLTPTVPQYDPKRNFSKLRFAWGWTPWEEPIGVIDSLLIPQAHEKSLEPSQGPGLDPQPAPAAIQAGKAAAK